MIARYHMYSHVHHTTSWGEDCAVAEVDPMIDIGGEWVKFEDVEKLLSDQKAALLQAEQIIDQFMPNVGKCFGIDFALLNEGLIAIRKALV